MDIVYSSALGTELMFTGQASGPDDHNGLVIQHDRV